MLVFQEPVNTQYDVVIVISGTKLRPFIVDYGCSNHTLMISTSWSTPLSPGNRGWKNGKHTTLEIIQRFTKDKWWEIIWKVKSTCPRSNSARTQPADHMSIAVVYSVAPNISSGAR